MRFLLSFCFVAALALGTVSFNSPASAEGASRFATVIDDLPLMAEIAEVGEGVEFSTPDGRIAEVITEGRVAQVDVLTFYAATLPQLGWTRTDEARFVREGEILALTFEQAGQTLRVRFTLAPLVPAKK